MSRVNRLHRRLWAAVRVKVIERDGYRCTRCTGAGRLEVHHVVDLAAGGEPYDLGNLATLCRSCHIELHRPKDYATAGRKAWKERLNGVQ